MSTIEETPTAVTIPSPEPGKARSSTVRRRTLALVVLGVVVVSSLATWLASSWIHSPAEEAARTAAPEPSPILVPVEERVLATRVVTRGTGVFGSPREISITPSALKEGAQILTHLPEAGAVVDEGDVLLTISGRPVFLLQGDQPSFRDLGPGMSGNDVRALEAALAHLGTDPGAVDGRYDAATESAVATFYRRHGYEAPSVTAEQLGALQPVEAGMVSGAKSSPGVHVPADEVVFVPASSIRVDKRLLESGVAPDGPVLAVTDSHIAVEGGVPVEKAALLKAGARGTIDEPALGIKTSGRISLVADKPGTNGLDSFHVFFRVVVDNPPPTLVGASVRVTVPVRSSGHAVLAVPASAVSLAADGSSRVLKSAHGQTEFVTVEPGFAADGYVAVTVVRGRLARGDRVQVGADTGSTGKAEHG